MGVVLAIALPLLGEKALVLLIPGFILLLGSIWFALKMAFFRGTPGPNPYGPDPVRARWERMRA